MLLKVMKRAAPVAINGLPQSESIHNQVALRVPFLMWIGHWGENASLISIPDFMCGPIHIGSSKPNNAIHNSFGPQSQTNQLILRTQTLGYYPLAFYFCLFFNII